MLLTACPAGATAPRLTLGGAGEGTQGTFMSFSSPAPAPSKRPVLRE